MLRLNDLRIARIGQRQEGGILLASGAWDGVPVLVTGASGFLGGRLLPRLAEEGAEIHAVSRHTHGDAEGRTRWWVADVADTESVNRLMSEIRPRIVFHLAGHVAGARDLSMVLPTFRANLMSSVNLFTAAVEAECERFVLVGSMEEPHPKEMAGVPCSPYAAAKWCSSAYARMFYALYKLSVVHLRVFMVYGPGQKDLRKLVPYVILSFLEGKAPQCSSGGRRVDWIYVDDVVEALMQAATVQGLAGQTIDVGTGVLTAVRDVVEEIGRLIDPNLRPMFGAVGDRPMEQEPVVDVSQWEQLGRWQPQVPLREGLARTVAWYREQKDAGRLSG